MTASILAETEILPEAFQFLHVGWWIVHVIAIPLVLYIGFTLGRRCVLK